MPSPKCRRTKLPCSRTRIVSSSRHAKKLARPKFGPAARSALGVGFGIETVFYCLYWGLGTAVASLVGRYLGEGELEKTLSLTRIAVRTNLILGVLICGIFLVGGEAMVRMLSNDEEVIAVNVEYLFFMSFARPSRHFR